MDATRPEADRRKAASARSRLGWIASAVVLAAVLLIVTFAIAGGSSAPRALLPRTASRVAPPTTTATVPGSVASSTTSTTTTVPVVPPSTPAPAADPGTTLLTPEEVPDPEVRRPIQVIGRIQIPKLGIDTELRNQITQESIDIGPSHWPGTAAPGGLGNTVIAGHRSNYSAPFHDFHLLRAGDQVVLVDANLRVFTYTITEMFIVNPDALWIADQAEGHTLTLFTCNPIGSAAQRLVVRATLN